MSGDLGALGDHCCAVGPAAGDLPLHGSWGHLCFSTKKSPLPRKPSLLREPQSLATLLSALSL